MSAKSELSALVQRINSNPEHIKGEKDRVFQVDLDEGETYQISIEEGQISVLESKELEPQVTLKLSEKNFIKLLNDDLNTTMAFMTGGLKVDGSLGLAMKLQEIVKKYQ